MEEEVRTEYGINFATPVEYICITNLPVCLIYPSGSEWVMLPGRWLCAQVSGGNCRHGTQILETQLGGNTAALSEGKLQPLNGEYLFTTDQDSRHRFMCNCPVSSAVRWYQPYKYATAAGIGSHRHVIRDGSGHAKKTHGHCSTEW